MKTLEIWLHNLLLFCGFLFSVAGSFIGINIGTGVSNLPSTADIVAILKSERVTHVRLFDADSRMLNALSNSGIEVMISVTNEEVLGIGESPSTAAAWINKNVATYVPSTNITAIAVGSEVLTSIPNAAPILVPAMNYLNKALVASNLNHLVKISTPHPMDIIPQPFPPSTATFNTTWNSTLFQILQFLSNTDSFFMLNAYPYYEYILSAGIFPLDYALFRPLSSVKQIVDPNTLARYNNMFDALIDSAYYSIAALNFSRISIVVTETGWPWAGGTNEPDATAQNAEMYNKNLVVRLSNNSGPPSHPEIPISAYIYELFNEDQRLWPLSEKNWGVLFTNGTPVYDLSLSFSDGVGANASSAFCIAKPGVDESALQAGLNWACGPGQSDCRAIQQGKLCYFPVTLQNHASYAYNDYYQKMHNAGGTCDFNGSALLTSVDPSYGSCRFTGSSNGTGGAFQPPAFGPVGAFSGSSRGLHGQYGTICTAISLLISVAIITCEKHYGTR